MLIGYQNNVLGILGAFDNQSAAEQNRRSTPAVALDLHYRPEHVSTTTSIQCTAYHFSLIATTASKKSCQSSNASTAGCESILTTICQFPTDAPSA